MNVQVKLFGLLPRRFPGGTRARRRRPRPGATLGPQLVHRVEIVDDDHQPLAAGKIGHVRYRGPAVAPGFFNDPEGSAQSFRDGALVDPLADAGVEAVSVATPTVYHLEAAEKSLAAEKVIPRDVVQVVWCYDRSPAEDLRRAFPQAKLEDNSGLERLERIKDAADTFAAFARRQPLHAQAPLLQAETSSLSQVVEQREIRGLPLNGRNVLQLIQLTPGTLGGAGSFNQSATRPETNSPARSSTSSSPACRPSTHSRPIATARPWHSDCSLFVSTRM